MSSDFLAGGGVFRGASAAPLGLGLSKVLGLQGGSLPGVAAAPGLAQPVIVVGDSSDQLNRVLAPPRFIAGATTNVPGVGSSVRIILSALATRTVIVEQVEVAALNPATPNQPVQLFVSRAGPVFPTAGFTGTNTLNIGGDVPDPGFGAQISARVQWNTGAFAGTQVPLTPNALLGLRELLVVPGGSVGFQTNLTNQAIVFCIRWREVPE